MLRLMRVVRSAGVPHGAISADLATRCQKLFLLRAGVVRQGESDKSTPMKTKTRAVSEVERLLRNAVDQDRAAERRGDSRIDTAIPVALIPCVGGVPDIERGFVMITKNISRTGLSVVVNRPMPDDDLLIGLPGKTTSFVTARVVHRKPMPLGCYKLGVLMFRLVQPGEYPLLDEWQAQLERR